MHNSFMNFQIPSNGLKGKDDLSKTKICKLYTALKVKHHPYILLGTLFI